MKNDRFYKIVIVLLLLLNVGTLSYLWLNQGKASMSEDAPGRPPRGPRNPVDHMMSERLQLTEEQEEAFRELKQEHHGQMLDIQQEERELHKGLFVLLRSKEVDTTVKNTLLSRLEDNDRRKEMVTFEHFQKLRALLTPDQLPMFDELVQDIAGRIMSHHRDGDRRPPPRH